MTETELALWRDAADLAATVMRAQARAADRRGRSGCPPGEDPLEWWCLTEAIAGVAERHKHRRSTRVSRKR